MQRANWVWLTAGLILLGLGLLFIPLHLCTPIYVSYGTIIVSDDSFDAFKVLIVENEAGLFDTNKITVVDEGNLKLVTLKATEMTQPIGIKGIKNDYHAPKIENSLTVLLITGGIIIAFLAQLTD